MSNNRLLHSLGWLLTLGLGWYLHGHKSWYSHLGHGHSWLLLVSVIVVLVTVLALIASNLNRVTMFIVGLALGAGILGLIIQFVSANLVGDAWATTWHSIVGAVVVVLLYTLTTSDFSGGGFKFRLPLLSGSRPRVRVATA